MKNAYFDEKLKNINKKVTLNKSKDVLAKNEVNELSEKLNIDKIVYFFS